jgi:transcriptional regulator with XRE-family HTH domain
MIFRLPSIRSALEFRREAYGWTQTKMAKALGLTRGHYSEIKAGKRGLPYRAACKAFEIGVPADVLLQTRKTKHEYEQRMNP